jgi:aminopeptidase
VPDGEFFFTPNPLKTEGTIYYDWSTVYAGRKIQGIRLTFKEGKVVEFSADKGQDYLEQALNTDEGSRFLGELGIGANFGITVPSRTAEKFTWTESLYRKMGNGCFSKAR